MGDLVRANPRDEGFVNILTGDVTWLFNVVG
jgi:hypothetical protein